MLMTEKLENMIVKVVDARPHPKNLSENFPLAI